MTLGAAVEVRNLEKSYGGIRVVDDVSLKVDAGEFVTLLGSSGSGKTTTLMMIAGFVKPDAGEMLIGPKEISTLPPERRGLGVVFQSYALFPHMTVFENIAFPLRLRRLSQAEIDRKVREVLELVDLGAFAARRIGALSGGQQQRIALARAIVFAPPVLLMDEPLGALDRRLRDQLQTEIKRIQQEMGVTVIYVTHDQEEALALSDRVAIMTDGRIEQLGSPDEVYEAPASPFVASFLGESNFIPVHLSPGALDAKSLVAMVRPEAIMLAAPGQEGTNCVQGVVRSREFLGATLRLTVTTKLGELSARVSRLSLGPELAVGSPVSLLWDASNMVIFPATAAANGRAT